MRYLFFDASSGLSLRRERIARYEAVFPALRIREDIKTGRISDAKCMTHLLCSPNAVSDATVLCNSVKYLTIKAVIHGIEIMVGPGPATQFESPGAAKFSRNKHTNRITSSDAH